MTTKLTKISSTIFAIALSIFTIAMSSPVFAATDIDACKSLSSGSIAYDAAGCNNSSDQLPITIINILKVIIGISGLIAVIFIIIGGINYMTSSGEAAKIKKAKDTILYACIGLAICALSFAIANWAITTINDSSTKSSSNSSNNSDNSN